MYFHRNFGSVLVIYPLTYEMLECERILRPGLSSLLTCSNNFYVRVLLGKEGVEKQECVF